MSQMGSKPDTQSYSIVVRSNLRKQTSPLRARGISVRRWVRSITSLMPPADQQSKAISKRRAITGSGTLGDRDPDIPALGSLPRRLTDSRHTRFW